MRPEDHYKLLFGPYDPPAVGIGDTMFDMRYGKVKVRRWSDGPIRWPVARWRNNPLILCLDLARAIRHESAVAVAHWWGVSPATVRNWREFLGVERLNEGSRRLQQAIMADVAFIEAQKRGLARSIEPEARAKRRATYALKRDQKEHIWTPEAKALLGSLSDEDVAAHLQCAVSMVRARRLALNIAPHDQTASRAYERRLYTILPERLRERRVELGRDQNEVAEQFGIREDQYGNYERGIVTRIFVVTLCKLARGLRCSPVTLLDPDKAGDHVVPVEAIEALIDHEADDDVAEMLGVPRATVEHWRRWVTGSTHRRRSCKDLHIVLSPEQIRARRIELGLTLYEAAHRAGEPVTYSIYGRVDRGNIVNVEPEVLQRIAGALMCPEGELLMKC